MTNTYTITERLEEGTDYELIPSAGQNWNIRILTGEFVESVLQYDKLTVSEDAEYITFNFDLVSSPDPELKEENVDLQYHAGKLLSSILENSIVTSPDKEKE